MAGLEAAGFLLGITGPIQQLQEGYTSLRNRYQHCQTNEHEAAAILHRSTDALSSLQSLQASLLQPYQDSKMRCFRDMVQCIVGLKENLEQVNDGIRLIQGQQQRKKWLQRFAWATATREEISKLQSVVEGVEDKLTGFHFMIAAVLHGLHINGNIGVSRGAPGTMPVAAVNVPRNQGWVGLDFDTLDPHGVPVTIEGKLLHLLMRGAKGKCSNGSHETVLHITADPGCGKSCSVRGLVHHPAIVDEYVNNDTREDCANEAGGVYYFKLEANVTETQIIKLLAAAVEKAGGWDIAKPIALSDSLFEAVCLVYAWFKNRRSLFIFDDALDNHPQGIQIALLLANLSLCSYSSGVLFTRRKRIPTNVGDHVHFSMTPTGAFAKQKFLVQAQLTEDDVRDELVARTLNQVLLLCNGALMALSSSGNCVRLLREMSKEDLGETLLQYLSRYAAIRKHEHYSQFDSDAATHFRMISVTLEVLTQRAQLTGPEILTKVKTFYVSLCTLGRGEWVPHSVLQRYWGLDTRCEAQKLCNHMVAGRLGCIEPRTVNGIEIEGFRIHNRARQYCMCKAEDMNVRELWSVRRSKFIDGIPHTELSEGQIRTSSQCHANGIPKAMS